MQWIFISPHFDDVALSCGGLVWELTAAGNEVSIWTICGGIPSNAVHSAIVDTLHERWKSNNQAAIIRQQEDIRSCQNLNADYMHFDLLDCIYRVNEVGSPLYPSEESLFGSIHPADLILIDHFAHILIHSIPKSAKVVCPLAIGNHVDHQLSRQIIEKTGKAAWYYADFPYVMKNPGLLEDVTNKDWTSKAFKISSQGYQAWLNSVVAHKSQISTFWKNKQKMNLDFRQYLHKFGGILLWRPKHK
ncbi:MAG: PIG-L family deacetylase [Chloroflexi bacterium]|nr:PIG-L family deacetylase [Chloroflexota bacterium]